MYLPSNKQAKASEQQAASKATCIIKQHARKAQPQREAINERTTSEIRVDSRERDTVSLQRVLTEIRKTADSKSPTNCNVQARNSKRSTRGYWETGSSGEH